MEGHADAEWDVLVELDDWNELLVEDMSDFGIAVESDGVLLRC